MDSERVSEKAARLFGAGILRYIPIEDTYVWVIEGDGYEFDLGPTLEEAWRTLDKYKKDATSKEG